MLPSDPEAARESEVTDFDLAFLVDQNVGWLQVAVDDVAPVQQAQGLQQVVGQNPHLVQA